MGTYTGPRGFDALAKQVDIMHTYSSRFHIFRLQDFDFSPYAQKIQNRHTKCIAINQQRTSTSHHARRFNNNYFYFIESYNFL